jgi:hypothetical protein
MGKWWRRRPPRTARGIGRPTHHWRRRRKLWEVRFERRHPETSNVMQKSRFRPSATSEVGKTCPVETRIRSFPALRAKPTPPRSDKPTGSPSLFVTVRGVRCPQAAPGAYLPLPAEIEQGASDAIPQSNGRRRVVPGTGLERGPRGGRRGNRGRRSHVLRRLCRAPALWLPDTRLPVPGRAGRAVPGRHGGVGRSIRPRRRTGRPVRHRHRPRRHDRRAPARRSV